MSDPNRPTKLPAIPSTLDPMQSALKENIEVLTGVRGNVLDRAVTMRDLQTAGLVKVLSNSVASIENIVSMIAAAVPDQTATTSVPQDYDVPPTPTGLTAAAGITTIQLQWDAPNFTNFGFTEIWRNQSNTFTGAVKIGQTTANMYADNVGGTGIQEYYWIRHVSNSTPPINGPYQGSNGVGAKTGMVGTTDLSDNLITAQKLATGSVDLSKFAGGITPVEITSSLPASGNYEGRTVFNNTDGKLYRYHNGAWTAAVPTSDLTGTIAGSQVAAGALDMTKFASGLTPVQIVGSLPTSGMSQGQVVFLTTDNKLYRYDGSAWKNSMPFGDLTGTIAASQIASNTITTGMIQAGAITASQIASGAITTDKLYVTGGKGAALNADPGCSDATAWNADSTTYQVVTLTDGQVGNSAIQNTAPNTWVQGSQRIPLDPSKTYRMRCWVRNNGSANGTLYVAVTLQDANGANISGDGTWWNYQAATNVSVPAGWTQYETVFGAGTGKTFPSNAKTMAPGVLLNYNGTTGFMQAQDIRIEEVLPGTLIQDGSITTAKISAGAVTADRIQSNSITAGQIAANTITAGQIASATITATQIAASTIQGNNIAANTITSGNIAAATIVASNIAAGTITADKLNVSTLSAITANMGTVNAGVVESNDGRTVFNLSGNTLTVSDGTRTRLQLGYLGSAGAYGIEIWDAAGNLFLNAGGVQTVTAGSITGQLAQSQLGNGAVGTAQIMGNAVSTWMDFVTIAQQSFPFAASAVGASVQYVTGPVMNIQSGAYILIHFYFEWASSQNIKNFQVALYRSRDNNPGVSAGDQLVMQTYKGNPVYPISITTGDGNVGSYNWGNVGIYYKVIMTYDNATATAGTMYVQNYTLDAMFLLR